MSHYTVAIILDKNIDESSINEAVEQALAPYDENMETERRLIKTKDDIISGLLATREEYELLFRELLNIGREAFSEKYNEWLFHRVERMNSGLSDTEMFADYQSGYSSDEFDEEGNQYSTYNENSKWDWWTVGGRWPSLINGKLDYARVKDINFNATNSKSRAREEYRGEPFFKKEFKSFEKFYALSKYTITYAVLDSKNDDWIEPGVVGWFASTDETRSSRIEYYKRCQEVFTKEVDPDDWVVIVDCHI